MPTTILNIAAGKLAPLTLEEMEPFFLVNLDTMYYHYTPTKDIEEAFILWTKTKNQSCNCKEDIFEFMERTILKFDYITIYRFLEHVPFVKVPYFIYLLSTVTHIGSKIEVIVPNYDILAEMILKESSMAANIKNFEAWNIELTTELLNEPFCPHASIWTRSRAKYFFELEKRFKINEIDPKFEFDGRDLYLRFVAERI